MYAKIHVRALSNHFDLFYRLEECWRQQTFVDPAAYPVLPLRGKHVCLCGFSNEGKEKAERLKLGRALEHMGACVERTFHVGTCDVVVASDGWRDGAEGREEAERWVTNAQAAGKWAVSEKWVWACVSAAKCVIGQEFVLGRSRRSLDAPRHEGEERGRKSEICCG